MMKEAISSQCTFCIFGMYVREIMYKMISDDKGMIAKVKEVALSWCFYFITLFLFSRSTI